MLADEYHRIDGQRLAAQAEGLIDCLEQRHLEPLGCLAGHIAIGKLIGVERNDIDARIGPFAAKQVRTHQARENVKGV